MPKLKFQKKNKILIVAAHPDDEMLGKIGLEKFGLKEHLYGKL